MTTAPLVPGPDRLARRWRHALGSALALASLLAPGSAAPATRLDYRGTVLSSAQVQTLVAPWLRAPNDSAAAAAGLGAIVARLQDLGYLDARARGWRDSLNGDRLVLDVREGRRRRLASIAVHAASVEDSAALASALPLAAGSWTSPRTVDEAIQSALRRVADHGYPYADFLVSGWNVDSAGVHLALDSVRGPRVTVSRVQIDGLRVTRPEFAGRAVGRLVGQPFDRAAAEAGRERLAQLGLFRSVTYAGLRGEGDWHQGRLLYRVEEPRYNQLEGALGVQGAAGTVGLARLELGNLMGTGRDLGLRWESRGRGVSQFTARYLEPMVLGTPLQLEGTVDQQLQDTLYTRTQWGGRAGFTLSSQERLEIGYEGVRVVQATGSLEQAWIQNTVFALERTTLDDRIAPRRGTRARVSATQSFKRETLRPPGSQSARASAVEGTLELHQPRSTTSGFSLTLVTAGRFSSERILPLYERYSLGGATTLRGFDEDAFRVDRYALSRFEWSRYLGGHGQRALLFWDHAWTATRDPLPAGGDRLEQRQLDGLGFGLRLEAAGGLVGVDYGLEPGRGALEGKIHLQLVSNF
jgi:outer membrane protein assembly factor BamA